MLEVPSTRIKCVKSSDGRIYASVDDILEHLSNNIKIVQTNLALPQIDLVPTSTFYKQVCGEHSVRVLEEVAAIFEEFKKLQP